MSLRSCEKRFKVLQKRKKVKTEQAIFFDIENQTITIIDNGIVIRRYSADDAKTIQDYHSDAHSRHKLIMGPRGSSKSSASIAEIFFKTYLNPACSDGVKRARWLVGRETYGELQTTTIKTFEHWFGHDCLGYTPRKSPPLGAKFKYFDGEAYTELEIYFISFDNEKSAKKALSLEVTGAYFNEAKMISIAAIDEIDGSLGRYPALPDRDQAKLDQYWTGIIYDTNSFEEYHPFYYRFVSNPDTGYAFFKQPGGMVEHDNSGRFSENKAAENTKNLVANYYMHLARGKSERFIRTQICNNFGINEEGKPVHAEYSERLHSVDIISFDNKHPILIGFDYGGTNAALIVQYVNGQLRAIKELIGYREGLREFAGTRVKDWLRDYAKDLNVKTCVGDPADNYSIESAKNSSKIVTESLGIKTHSAVTNEIKRRVDSVDKFILSRSGSGEPGLLISRSGCPTLHAGLGGKYHLKLQKTDGNERVVQKPAKDGIYDHPNDCLQYLALEVLEGAIYDYVPNGQLSYAI